MVKALIRNPGETITENTDLTFIDWSTGAPLTDAGWYGGRYTLVQNYYLRVDEGDETYDEIIEPEQNEEVTVTEDTVIIDGKEYTKAELRALLGE